eukprot:748382-Hanusia_phi.AAC.2
MPDRVARTVNKAGPNKGRQFFTCKSNQPACRRFFKWDDTNSGMADERFQGGTQASNGMSACTFSRAGVSQATIVQRVPQQDGTVILRNASTGAFLAKSPHGVMMNMMDESAPSRRLEEETRQSWQRNEQTHLLSPRHATTLAGAPLRSRNLGDQNGLYDPPSPKIDFSNLFTSVKEEPPESPKGQKPSPGFTAHENLSPGGFSIASMSLPGRLPAGVSGFRSASGFKPPRPANLFKEGNARACDNAEAPLNAAEVGRESLQLVEKRRGPILLGNGSSGEFSSVEFYRSSSGPAQAGMRDKWIVF